MKKALFVLFFAVFAAAQTPVFAQTAFLPRDSAAIEGAYTHPTDAATDSLLLERIYDGGISGFGWMISSQEEGEPNSDWEVYTDWIGGGSRSLNEAEGIMTATIRANRDGMVRLRLQMTVEGGVIHGQFRAFSGLRDNDSERAQTETAPQGYFKICVPSLPTAWSGYAITLSGKWWPAGEGEPIPTADQCRWDQQCHLTISGQ